jgi:pimeloyl-ACP methyl ester carboxylesterase
MRHRVALLGVFVILLALLLAACGATPTATPPPPTAPPVPPTAVSTNTPPLPTNTVIPPTNTPPLPTNTVIPPTKTPVPATATPTALAKIRSYVEGLEWPKMVNVGAYDLYVQCFGSGSPVVFVEPGLLNTVSAWTSVANLVKTTTTICIYNRANVAPSGKAPMPRSSGQIIEDLHNLVAMLEIKKPFVLVGHSMGGFQSILYSNRWPSDVAGLILVDSTHPDQSQTMASALPAPAAGESQNLTRLRQSWVTISDPAPFPPDQEGWDYVKSVAEARAVKSLGSLPLTVIAAGPVGRTSDLSMNERIWDMDWIPAYVAVGIGLQKDFLKLSTNSTYLESAKAGHQMSQEDPEFVSGAIVKMVEQVRKK